jgi:hypothetical protein
MENDGLDYIAGWIAKKHGETLNLDLGAYSHTLTGPEHEMADGSWSHQISRGGLYVPNQSHKDNCVKLDKFFNKHHGMEFRSKLKYRREFNGF